MPLSRRKVLQLLLAAGAALAGVVLAGYYWLDRKLNPRTPLNFRLPAPAAASGPLALTPSCPDGHAEPSAASTEGPFYKPDSPERTLLRDANTVGRPLAIAGQVMDQGCHVIEGAVLDFWCCDGTGHYDNAGYRLRGHQFTDAAGAYQVGLVKPKDYGLLWFHRTPHVHVKIQGRETALLTTQLFFPGETLNARDRYMDDRLLMTLTEAADGSLLGRFDFVLARPVRDGA
jgi:protocatechuate 3,4-dioxygenase beta subunit